MKKNKILTICLISLLSFSAMVGCGKKDKDGTEDISNTNSYVLSEGKTPINSRTGLGFDMYSNTKDNFTVYGITESLDESILYDSAMISSKLLASENMKIVYTAEIPHNLLLLCDSATTGTININGTSYDVTSEDFGVELDAGEYTITTTDVNLLYILISEVNHTITISFADGTEISFNLDEVESSKDGSNTIYTFWDDTEVKVDSNGVATVIKEGTSGIFSSTFYYDNVVEEETNEEIEEMDLEDAIETGENKEDTFVMSVEEAENAASTKEVEKTDAN